MENIRLDKIFEFWDAFGKSNKENLEDKKPRDVQNIDEYGDKDVSTLKCSVCKKNIPYRTGIKRPYQGMENCLKEIKKIFSQLQIYGICSTFKCVCYECSSKKENSLKAILKDQLNNKFIIEGSLDDFWGWEEEVDFIIELIRFYKAFSYRSKNMQGKLYKSRKAKDLNISRDGITMDPLVAIEQARIEVLKQNDKLANELVIGRNGNLMNSAIGPTITDKSDIKITPFKFG